MLEILVALLILAGVLAALLAGVDVANYFHAKARHFIQAQAYATELMEKLKAVDYHSQELALGEHSLGLADCDDTLCAVEPAFNNATNAVLSYSVNDYSPANNYKRITARIHWEDPKESEEDVVISTLRFGT